MSVCQVCNGEMLKVKSCSFTKIGKKPIDVKGNIYKKIKFLSDEELGIYGIDTTDIKKCHDCGVLKGGYHHDGCDAERCPKCSSQLISCGCEFDLLIK